MTSNFMKLRAAAANEARKLKLKVELGAARQQPTKGREKKYFCLRYDHNKKNNFFI